MSEFQYYEFLTIDRPLNTAQQAEVRALSTRARITSTSFTNEYHWGDFRGDPRRMMERYYDAHLYVTNWGTQQVMLRLPRTLLPPDVVEPYCAGDQVTAWTTREHLILDLTSEDEEADFDQDPEGLLAALVGVRAELAAGDLRPLYLAWLSAYGAWERDEDAFDYADQEALEPPLPAGLGSLTAPQQALADYLRLDPDLLTVAAEASPPMPPAPTGDRRALAAWITALPAAEKDVLLLRVVQDRAAQVRMELLRRFQGEPAGGTVPPSRTVANLLDAATERRQDRKRRRAAEHAAEQARLERQRAQAREKRLTALAQDEDTAWARIDALIATKKPTEYDKTVELLKDLQIVAQRAGRSDEFTRRFAPLRQKHLRKPSLIQRFDRAGLITPSAMG
ncbi:hypothetical protein Misp01_11320 [Microtetraspora sp. NBRC 13810]|uniref:hypothetical protein n=1 Tax=Microtetraspora sp. NBRC 13810 TaxID=3030990 RepID=UPI0024A2B9F4|nr:hypothetical protein [Microtetraspora sp. NBRC 13810]GLW06002.1 hypothetical protein Misp01_11320 [Microtetraspora sp. NBRC 13810]